MNEALVVALVILATHRITRLITTDTIFDDPRLKLQLYFEQRWENKTGRGSEETWGSKLAYLISCSWCTGLWVAAAVTVGTDLTAGVTAPVLTALAASTVTGVIEELTASKS